MSDDLALSANTDRPVETPVIDRGWLPWLESAVITCAFSAVAVWAGEDDPAAFQGNWTWLLGPLVCGLRYGSRYGLASAACLVAVAATWYHFQQLLAWPIFAHGVGIVLAGIVAGEVSDRWQRRLNYLRTESHYHRLRLEEFSREYHTLRLSHLRLEQKLAAHNASLRNALLQLNQRILTAQVSRGEPLGGLGEPILRLFAEHAPLHIAALYAISKPARLTLCARLGKPAALPATNDLLQEALRAGQVASIPSLTVPNADGVIAIVPLSDIHGEIHAVLAIHEMPYAAFQPSTLNTFAVIGGHVGDMLRRHVHALAPDLAKKHFSRALHAYMEDYRRYGVPVGLIVFKLSTVADALSVRLLMNSRGIDRTGTCSDAAGQPAVLKLMPLTDLAGLTSYVRRIASAVKQERGDSYKTGMSSFVWSLPSATSAEESLPQFCQRCNIDLLSSDHDIQLLASEEQRSP